MSVCQPACLFVCLFPLPIPATPRAETAKSLDSPGTNIFACGTRANVSVRGGAVARMQSQLGVFATACTGRRVFERTIDRQWTSTGWPSTSWTYILLRCHQGGKRGYPTGQHCSCSNSPLAGGMIYKSVYKRDSHEVLGQWSRCTVLTKMYVYGNACGCLRFSLDYKGFCSHVSNLNVSHMLLIYFKGFGFGTEHCLSRDSWRTPRPPSNPIKSGRGVATSVVHFHAKSVGCPPRPLLQSLACRAEFCLCEMTTDWPK